MLQPVSEGSCVPDETVCTSKMIDLCLQLNGYISWTTDDNSMSLGNMSLTYSLSEKDDYLSADSVAMSTADLLSFAYQIAKGMNYLASIPVRQEKRQTEKVFSVFIVI